MADRFIAQDDPLSVLLRGRLGAARRRYLAKIGRTKVPAGPEDGAMARVTLPFQVMAHFADAPVNLYQIRQWLAPLERLNEKYPVVLVTRNSQSFRTLVDETSLSMINARRIGTLDAICTGADLKVCFYVNQTRSNFSVLRYPDMFHVYLSHGESEKKMYMASNQIKAYDYVFAAGDAAVERIRSGIVRYDVDANVIQVGRPQLDVPVKARTHADATRRTVAYAPTWEGDRPSTAYGSAASHGSALVKRLLADPTIRLVYRPHPRIGQVLQAAADADRDIRSAIEVAAKASPKAEHRVDTSPLFSSLAEEADLLICDISAVALDFLPTKKPIAVTLPVDPRAIVDLDSVMSSVYLLPVKDVPAIQALVKTWINDDTRQAERSKWVHHYFGDVTAGASMTRFLDACDRVVTERDAGIAERDAGR